MQKKRKLVAVTTVCVVFCLSAVLIFSRGLFENSPEPPRLPAPEASYRTVDVVFATHRSQGWAVSTAPTDGRRYRICGATESDPKSGASSHSGVFQSGGRRVEFDVKVPTGKVVAVEGLDPIDGGPLTYAVLTRDRADSSVD